MRRPVLAILLLSVGALAQGTYTASANGSWTDATKWTLTAGTPCNATNHFPVYNGDPNNTVGITCGDTATIPAGITMTCPAATLCSVGNSPGTTSITLNSVNAHAAGVTVYNGTITGGASNGLVGQVFLVTGFTSAANNGSFVCTASTASTLTLQNNLGVVETTTTTATTVMGPPALVLNGNGNLIINGTFIYAGRVQPTTGTITMGPGSKLQYDSSYSPNASTVNYTIDDTAVNSTASSFLWSVAGTSGSHVVIDGDSFDSGHAKSGTVANTDLAGALNYSGSSIMSTSNQGQGTFAWLDIKNVGGSPIYSNNASVWGFAGNIAWLTTVLNNNGGAIPTTSFNSVTVTNSNTFELGELSGATANITVNALAITNSAYTQTPLSGNPAAYGCFHIFAIGATSQIFSISNSYFDCLVNDTASATTYTSGVWQWSNVMAYRTPAGSNPGQYVGPYNNSLISPNDSFDEFFSYPSTFYTGTPSFNRPLFPLGAFMINSVWYSPKATKDTAPHILAFTGGFTSVTPNLATTVVIKNNVFGGAGSITQAHGFGTVVPNVSAGMGGGTPSQNITINASGNVIVCDQTGRTGFGTPYARFTATISSHTVSVNYSNNTICASVGGNGGITTNSDWGANGAIGFEGSATQGGLIQSANSNLFWNPLNMPIGEVCDVAAAAFVPPNPKPVALLTNNAVVNTNTSIPAICGSGGSGANDPINWVTTGPQNDVTMLNHLPVMVDITRDPITFDYYLVPAGLMPGSTPGQTPLTYWQAQGATQWAYSTSYAKGALVYDQQAVIHNGLYTFWRCINLTNCNSGATGTGAGSDITRPATGYDTITPNYFMDYNVYWQPAYFQAWLLPQILLGTVFYEGAVPLQTDVNGNREPMHAIGLLNAWIRQGRKTMEPTLWRGCLNNAECGNSYAIIQHIFPAAVVN